MDALQVELMLTQGMLLAFSYKIPSTFSRSRHLQECLPFSLHWFAINPAIWQKHLFLPFMNYVILLLSYLSLDTLSPITSLPPSMAPKASLFD